MKTETKPAVSAPFACYVILVCLGPLKLPAYAQAPTTTAIGEDQIFQELVRRNQIRNDELREYTANRAYRVSDPRGKIHAAKQGRMEFHAPDVKRFTTTGEEGSGIVRRLALNPLISSEIKAAAGKDHHDSAITPANYRLKLLGEEDVRNYSCYVLQATPTRIDKYLFEGKVWVDKQDFAVVRIEGHPAASLSFWIKRADFVRDYQRVDGFWLPHRDETVVQVRIYGRKVLTIDHQDYTLNGNPASETVAGRALPR